MYRPVSESYSTINPCNMCMPMGSVLAFRGVEGCMPLFHGSQGCATYMRLYLAHHFREPVDIASSALSEKGTVYGGSANLKMGLKNLIIGYSPKAIGVATTCLAETIGDDIVQ
ncbi:MAG TPA: nitrogenase component 1, partial [Methanothrix soehngenii]|nr:nitrogenase component 1 [Methanothrix soehngenii]